MHHKYNYLILYNNKNIYKINYCILLLKTPIAYSDTLDYYPGLALF